MNAPITQKNTAYISSDKLSLLELENSNKFINLLMVDGKKSRAIRLFYDTLVLLKRKNLKENSKKESLLGIIGQLSPKNSIEDLVNNSNKLSNNSNEEIKIPLIDNSKSDDKSNLLETISVLEVLSIALKNVTPSVELRKVRRAGNTFLIPAILSQHKANTLAIRWVIESAKKKQQNSKQNFAECLADEIYQAYLKQGKARQKRDELHSAAISNRANIRYRWW
uniref:Small ribosomal subunit protein uS7m n=1 Tax=Prototheca wickerhamii TaxID=3111 RepID=RT07_PROWI|nr:ribosomal protein S7 [Prototheca wickerhamii]P46745.1 RecName: Full=Small ribosomal subunit protein uS7m; AltName: Full=Ribosomal protein S7, mitochondrial [Prototheca wickerhamii]AAD12661.1 ribosomal protein S7 [Prototheca wickerhamii]